MWGGAARDGVSLPDQLQGFCRFFRRLLPVFEKLSAKNLTLSNKWLIVWACALEGSSEMEVQARDERVKVHGHFPDSP
jgi:hypothetical protein